MRKEGRKEGRFKKEDNLGIPPSPHLAAICLLTGSTFVSLCFNAWWVLDAQYFINRDQLWLKSQNPLHTYIIYSKTIRISYYQTNKNLLLSHNNSLFQKIKAFGHMVYDRTLHLYIHLKMGNPP